MRQKLIKVVALIVAPYLYIKMYAAGIRVKVRPSDYFIQLLSKNRGRFSQATLLVILLSISARSYDAVMALRAAKSLYSSIPWWALSIRDVRLLLEASIWLESENEFDEIKRQILHKVESSDQFLGIVVFYKNFLQDGCKAIDGSISNPVLPGLLWVRVADKLISDGLIRESADALLQALRFVPKDDPKRAELILRLSELGVCQTNCVSEFFIMPTD